MIDRDGRVLRLPADARDLRAAIPANPGVNPSLTITALAERTMSKVPPKPSVAPVAPVRMTWEVPRPQTAIVPGSPEADIVEPSESP